jgi:glycosyltransferase involved in cell wall biosynthesis
VGFWCYLQKREKSRSQQIHWVTNKTLWQKFFNQPAPEGVSVLTAGLKYFRYTSRLFYPLYIIFLYYRKRCTSIHVATSIIDSLYLVRLFNIFGIPYCFTFASNSLDMAGYGDERSKRRWQKLFSLAKNIEVLNPTNSVMHYRGRKFITPTSFPYLPEFRDIPEEHYFNPNRDDLLIFCGSFVPQKNPVLALEGFAKFLERYNLEFPSAQLALIGKGDQLIEVKERMERINQQYGPGRVVLIPDTDLITSLAKAKIFLSLQDYDNYPSQSVMEAMLFCTSVVSINNGDTRKLVDETKGNFLLETKDANALGDAIYALLSGWKLNRQNREHILESFSPKIFADYFFDLHQEISDKNGD